MSTRSPLRISIIGCGWLGRPLYQKLSATHDVTCLTRRSEEAMHEGYCYAPKRDNSFWDSDIVIIAISTKDHYLETLEALASKIRANANLILMSSISVYHEYDGEVDEESVITQPNRQYEAEQLILGMREKVVILRLGGLMGADRISGRWSRRSMFVDGPVNYVHRDDVIKVVETLLERQVHSGVYNVVAPEHPLRSSVHSRNADRFGFHVGKFEGMSKRRVLSKRIGEELDYRFIHPDPLDFW